MGKRMWIAILVAVICRAPEVGWASGGNDAVFVGQSVPAAMLTGGPFEVSVTIRNTGTTTWAETGPNPWRLGSQDPQDNDTWGAVRILLDPSEQVAPLDEKTFAFEVVAPDEPGTYSFQWRMVQEGQEWFGEFTPAVAVVVSLAPPRYLAPDGVTFPWQKQWVALHWSPVPAADSFTVSLTDLTAGTTQTHSGLTGYSATAPVQAGHSYSWTVAAVAGSTNQSAPAQASFSVRANVPDVTPPTLSLLAPTAGTLVSGTILVSTMAADDVGIQRVELAANGQASPLVLHRPPYLFYWDSQVVADGPHVLTATAFDAADNSAAATVTVSVDNSESNACIPPGDGTVGDEVAINAALNAPGAVALLCPGAVYHLHDAIHFSFPGQDIHTKGFPIGAARAKLVVDGGASGAAIDGVDLSGLMVRNLRIDGNRGSSPPAAGGKALVALGGNGQDLLVAHVKAYDPRSWSTVHLTQGDPDPALGCARGLVVFNGLGPAGHPADYEWADGISLACRNSRVTHNLILDATDGGIVVFASPGSLIANNIIVAATRELHGGINMVDYGPFLGDYRGTVVAGNTISATGAPIRVAVGMGPNVMFCVFDDAHRNVGGRVVGNLLTGAFMHYGFVANGVADWTVQDNVSLATHSGVPESVCGFPLPSPPAPFLKDPLHAGWNLQPEFVDGQVDYLLDVHP